MIPITNADTGEKRWVVQLCATHGYTDPYLLPGGRYACILPLLFTHAIIVGTVGNHLSYENRWCYHTASDARAALVRWDGTGEPQGWHKHPATGRRRPSDEMEVQGW